MGEIVKQQQDYFIELDRRDQDQIIAEAMGETATELFYEVQGKKGLSYKGIITVTFLQGDIETEPWFQREKIVLNNEAYWSTTVRALNKTFGLAALGTAEVPEMMDVHDVDDKKWIKNPDGSWKMHKEFDRFCLRKSMSMAQRNAKAAVMPTPMLAKWLEYFMKRAAGDKEVKMPFSPKVVSADYKVLPDGGGETKKTPAKENQSQQSKRPGDFKPKLKPPSVDIIKYNLKAIDPKYEEVVEVLDQGEEIMVAPIQGIALSEADQYKIDEALKPWGIWKDRFWIVDKKARASPVSS